VLRAPAPRPIWELKKGAGGDILVYLPVEECRHLRTDRRARATADYPNQLDFGVDRTLGASSTRHDAVILSGFAKPARVDRPADGQKSGHRAPVKVKASENDHCAQSAHQSSRGARSRTAHLTVLL